MSSQRISVTSAEILDKHKETIKRERASDEPFHELWCDYIEVASAINAEDLSEKDEVELVRLRAALEAEILENLSLYEMLSSSTSSNLEKDL